MTVHRGGKGKYLGMHLDFTEEGVFQVDTSKYVEDVISDFAHMVHWDCKGQTGAAMTMGRGAVLSYSWKQKLNTKSSTETELIGVDDAISNILWSLNFCRNKAADNKSSILLETNGQMSSGKRTKHIKAKYFFFADKVAQGKIKVKLVPTEKMWADMNTKPKQGLPFCID
eukprot:CCRYP_019109-RA/>CCRYP_019109-RA protein AED:0.39 eAED:0.39 QI:0/0/0/1/0/0/2/0/169